jgi:prepilin signal peptidase PulO-like enzyme (type II secretory pathway)
LTAAAVFFIGLIWGSFVNMLSYRLVFRESLIAPRSHCDSCFQPLPVIYMLPVLGYCWCQGRCRQCGAAIPWRYPLTELVCGAAGLLIYLQHGWSLYAWGGLVFALLLLTCAGTDLQSGYIFNVVTYPGIILGLGFSFFQGAIGPALIGMLLLGLVYFLVLLGSHGGMGGGDVKMALMIGAFCKMEGAFITFILAALLAAGYVALLMLRGQARRGAPIKFGPFLAVGSYLAYVYGPELMDFYIRILSR